MKTNEHYLEINRKQMNGKNSVLECNPDSLIDEYKKTGCVKHVFETFNINYSSSRQIKHFLELRNQYGIDEIKLYFGMTKEVLKEKVLQNIVKANNLSDLMKLCGVSKTSKSGSISSQSRIKFQNFCLENEIEFSFSKQNTIYNNHFIPYKGSFKYSDTEIFCMNSCVSQQTIKKRFLKTVEYKCSLCGIIEWNGKELKMDMDHIDGNPRNNTIQNLRLLCPNCHSQTNTFSGKNRKNH